LQKDVNKILFALRSKEEKLTFLIAFNKAINEVSKNLLREDEVSFLNKIKLSSDLVLDQFDENEKWKCILKEKMFLMSIAPLEVLIIMGIRDKKIDCLDIMQVIFELANYEIEQFDEKNLFQAIDTLIWVLRKTV